MANLSQGCWPTVTSSGDRERYGATSSSGTGSGGRRRDELKKGWWKVGMPVMERRASGGGVEAGRLWDRRQGRRKPAEAPARMMERR